jgi:hypothetical protein
MKRRRVIFILLGVMVAAVLASVVFWEREPRYQGRALSTWIDREIDAQYEANGDSESYELDPKWRAATNAVYQIGTNAVPWLLKWSNASDSKLHAEFLNWLDSHRRLRRLRLHFRSAADRRGEANIGFILLKDRAKPAWPVFVQWAADLDPARRTRGWDLLMYTDADRETMLPVAQRLLKGPDGKLKELAAQVIRERYSNNAVP